MLIVLSDPVTSIETCTVLEDPLCYQRFSMRDFLCTRVRYSIELRCTFIDKAVLSELNATYTKPFYVYY